MRGIVRRSSLTTVGSGTSVVRNRTTHPVSPSGLTTYRLSPTQLYSSLMISSGTMTNRIDQLERARLVIRLPDPTDRRGVMVELTPQGRELVDEVVEAHAATEQRLVSILTDEEKEYLSATLRKLLLTLERDEGEVESDTAEEPA